MGLSGAAGKYNKKHYKNYLVLTFYNHLDIDTGSIEKRVTNHIFRQAGKGIVMVRVCVTIKTLVRFAYLTRFVRSSYVTTHLGRCLCDCFLLYCGPSKKTEICRLLRQIQ